MKKCTTVLVGMMIAAATAVAADTISEESLLSSHENRDAYTPAVAYGKDTYLIVWQSGRFGEGDLRKGFEGLGIGDIVGCRIDKSGKPLDAKPFVICGAKDLQEHPKVVFGNGVFLVVWHDLRGGKDWDVYAARVTPDGKVLDADGLLVAGGANNQACPRVTFDGKDFVVVWQDFRSNSLYESYGARVSSDGKVLDAQGVLIQSGKGGWGYHCELPAAASPGGGRSLLLWLGQTCFSGAGAPTAGTAIFADGKPTPAATFKEKDHGPGTAASPACLAAGKTAFLAVWRTDSTGGRGNAPNASSAMVLDTDGKLVKRLHVAGGSRIQAPDAAWDGTSFVAAWHQTMMAKANANPYQGVFVARVSEAGEPVGAAQSISGTFASPAAEPGVASDGAGATAIVYEKHPEKGDVPIRIGFRLLGSK